MTLKYLQLAVFCGFYHAANLRWTLNIDQRKERSWERLSVRTFIIISIYTFAAWSLLKHCLRAWCCWRYCYCKHPHCC